MEIEIKKENSNIVPEATKKTTKKEIEIKEEMGMVNIPVDPLNPHVKTLEVTINGVTTILPRGKGFKLSKAVEEVIEKSKLMG